MPKQIVKDVFGELLETGKATAKAGKKAAGDVAKGAVKAASGHSPKSSDSLDWLEKGMARQKKAAKVKQAKSEDQQREDQIDKLKNMDNRRSSQAYKQIQDQIRMIQKQKEAKPRKYITAETGFDEEQVKDPETYFEKMKKKKEEMKKKLPWNKPKVGGTGELRRGASG